MATVSTLRRNLQRALSSLLADPALAWITILTTRFPKSEIYLVGGAVRDAAIGRKDKKDYDFVVRKVPPAELEAFLAEHGSVDFVGRTFGVFKFYPKDSPSSEALDIALPRTDHAFGTGGYKAVAVDARATLAMKTDLARRDFTVNAMAVNLRTGALEDPFDGLQDLASKTLRGVGLPRRRFAEDYSRMLRAIRFACQLGLRIERGTWKALAECMPHINDTLENQRIVPHEVIAKEMVRSFVANPVAALDLYNDSGALAALLPEALKMKTCPHPAEYHSEGDVFAHTRLALQQLDNPRLKRLFPEARQSALVVFGTLLHDIGKPVTVRPTNEPGGKSLLYYGHDKVGGEMAAAICQRLRLSTLPKESVLHIDADALQWIIAKHLLVLNARVEELRASTIERYFFNDHVPGRALLAVILADSLATVPLTGASDLTHFRALLRRMKHIEKTAGPRHGRYRQLPAPLLRGTDVMTTFGLEPGQKIGKLLRQAREQQLQRKLTTKEEALAYLKKRLARKKTWI